MVMASGGIEARGVAARGGDGEVDGIEGLDQPVGREGIGNADPP